MLIASLTRSSFLRCRHSFLLDLLLYPLTPVGIKVIAFTGPLIGGARPGTVVTLLAPLLLSLVRPLVPLWLVPASSLVALWAFPGIMADQVATMCSIEEQL